MAVEVKVEGVDKLIDRFGKLPSSVAKSLAEKMLRTVTRLQTLVKETKLSGQVLRAPSGTLRRSINQKVSASSGGDEISGSVGTNVKYAKIHEYGGTVTIPAHMRRSKAKTWTPATLRMAEGMGMIHVQEHKATFKKRSFLRSTFKEQRSQIEKEFGLGLQDGVSESGR